MDFSLGSLEELYAEGVLDPRITRDAKQGSCNAYKKVADRIYVLYDPQKAAASPAAVDFDVLLLHGIGSDEFKCWTNAKGVLWPAVFFPQDFPTARVLTVGYAHSLFVRGVPSSGSTVSQGSETTAAPQADKLAVGGKGDGESTETTAASGVVAAAEANGVFHDLKALTKRAERAAVDSVSAYAPDALSSWLLRSSGPRRVVGDAEPSRLTAALSTPGRMAPSSHLISSASHPSSSVDPKANANARIPPLSGTRDFADSPVSIQDYPLAEHRASSATDGRKTDGGRAASVRDPGSVQSMQMVAAELAERLLSPTVGLGQRPLVFVVHSMGGLVLKQMIVYLFEAVRLASASAALDLSIMSSGDKDSATDGSTVRKIEAAVPQAKELLRSLRGIVFYSTPHFGSAMASVIAGLRQYYQGLGGLVPTSVVTGLGDHNREELVRLNDRFLEVVDRLGSELPFEDADAATVSAAHDTDTVKRFVETMESSLGSAQSLWSASGGSLSSSHSVRDTWVGAQASVCILSFGETERLNGLVRVVEPESANLAPGDPRCVFRLIKADHSQINRPISKTSPSYAMLYGFFDRMQQRGLLAHRGDRISGVAPLLETAACDLPSMSGVPGVTGVEELSWQYETGWATLFDPEKHSREPATDCGDTVAVGSFLPRASASEDTLRISRCRVAAYQRGLGEARLAVPFLEDTLMELQKLLRHFFGVATPSPLDNLFLLATDMREFLEGFYSPARLATTVAIGGEGHDDVEKKSSFCEGVLVDEVVSFRVPLQLVTYWARQGVQLLRAWEQTKGQLPVYNGSDGKGHAGSSSSPSMLGTGVMLHPTSRDFREVEHRVNILQEEWENFRRYVSLRIRASQCAANAKPIESLKSSSARGLLLQTMSRKDAPLSDHVAVLFFARAILAVVSDQVHEGGALGGLLGAYLRSAMLQVHGSEQHVSIAHFDNPWLLLVQCDSSDATSLFSAVLDSLELSVPSYRAKQGGSVLVDASGSRVDWTEAAEMRAITPSLTATSAMLLGFFSLYVDELDRLDAAAGGWTSLRHFNVAVAALEADVRARSRLLRGASLAMQAKGVAASAVDIGPARVQRLRGADWLWSGRVWRLTSARAEGSGAKGAFSAKVAGVRAEARCRSHVASLDDGLFISALQLVATSFECLIRLDGWRSQALMRSEPGSQFTSPPVENASVGAAAVHGSSHVEHVQSDLVSIGEELARLVCAAHKAYGRTSNILHGLSSADMEQPFAVSEKPTNNGVLSTEATTTEEGNTRECFRDLLRGFLHRLESNDVRDDCELDSELDTSQTPAGGIVGHVTPSLTWSSIKMPVPKARRQAFRRGSVADTTNIFTKSSFSSPAANLSSLMKSFAEAWEEIRRGGVAVETPEYFAYNAMAMWWVVEREASAVLRASAAALSIGEDTCKTGLSGVASPGSLRRALADSEKAWQHRREVTAAASSSSDANSASNTRAAERQCWGKVNSSLRCRWLTLCGSEEFLRTFHNRLEEDRRTLRELEASRFDGEPRDKGESFASPVKAAAVERATEDQLPIPNALPDALREDDTNAELHCWFGHCYTANRVASLDAAHAYLQAICKDRSRSRVHTAVAEVGLAWNRIHQVQCNSLQLWRLTAVQGAATTTSLSDTAALLSYRVSSVVDTSALHTVPAALRRFHYDALLHHTRTVQRYRRSLPLGTLHNAACRESRFSPTLSAIPPLTCFPTGASLGHLRRAEEGFQRALQIDPMNVGALCGLGRLRSLCCRSEGGGGGLGAPFADGGRESLLSWNQSWLPSRQAAEQWHTRLGTGTTDPCWYFQAALRAAASGQVSALSDVTPIVGCVYAMEPIWCSYAAYWLSEGCLRTAPVEEAFSVPPPTTTPPTTAHAAAVKWLRHALNFYPRNDWALTSLGLLYLETSASSQTGPVRGEVKGARSVGAIGFESSRVEAGRHGLSLLQRALAINPTNMWALWGVGTYGKSIAERDACQRLLRHLIVKSIRLP